MPHVPFIQKSQRFLLKLSGEALQGKRDHGIDVEFLIELAGKVVKLAKSGKQIIVVIGWGNIFRWVSGAANGLDRSSADYMGMLATVMNGIALGDAIQKQGQEVRIMSALEINRVSELFIRNRAMKHLEKKRVIIAVAGSGNPFFTTDSAAVLRALELGCDVIVKGTKVDGVYDKDPAKFPDAKRFETLALQEALEKNLRVMDQSALALAKDEKIPLFVCRIEDIDKLGSDEIRGTLLTP
jgi:uridylate kinase